MPMKAVLFLDSPLISTGYASTCRLTAKELSKRGYDVYGISFNGGPQNNDVVDWYGIKILPNYALQRNIHANYGDAQTIVKIFNDLNPDILFFHNDSYRYSYIESLPKNILDRSVFWLPFEGEQQDSLGVALFSKCAATRFVTNHALDLHRPMLKDKDIGSIPHAIDLESYTIPKDKAAAKRAKNLGIENKFVVVRVDRHQPRKYWDLTLRAFAAFAADKDDVFLLAKCNPRDLVMFNEQTGEGIDLKAIAKGLGIENKVFFDDYFFSAPSMAGCFYHAADVFLTTTSGEGFGLTPVEAMACGLPIICPTTPVLPEVLGDGAIYCKLKGKEWYDPMKVFHNIVDIGDVKDKLDFCYHDWKTGGKMLADVGARGRAVAEKNYSPQVVYDQWDVVFKGLSERKELVSIVTVLYNVSGEAQLTGEKGIEHFHKSLMENVSHPYEWIVVDNDSPKKQETRAWMEKAAKENPRMVPVHSDLNLGFAGGCNLGISKSKGAAVILTNPDSQALSAQKLNLPADFAKMMFDKSKSDPAIGIIGMEVNRRDDILQGSMFPYFCNVMITRTCLDACQFAENKWFNEQFWPAYYEDLDFTLRAMGKGFKIAEHNVPFWHKSGGTNEHMIEGGKDGPHVKNLQADMEKLLSERPGMADFGRKAGEMKTTGMQGLIAGNIAFLQNKWGLEERQKIKIVWDTHIGASVGFSQIAEGLIPELHKLGFDVYVNDWSNSANVEDPLIRQLIEKTRRAHEETDDLDNAIHIVCWLMETFLQVDADYKVGTSFCESTKVRPQYLTACNGMDRILTFSEFCRGVQKDSGYTSPIHVLPPGIHPIFMNYYERPVRDKFTFLSVGVSQERKDTHRLVEAFCEAFPKDHEYFPECEPGINMKPGQVELVLKSNNFGELSWVEREGWTQRANIRTIFTGWTDQAQRKDYTMQEMYDLYTSADCLVHPSHGEGIGMPILEAAATGMPVIFTNWSSPKEYLDESNSYPCTLGPNGTDMTEAYRGHGVPGENGLWANIHIGHLKHQMRHVLRNRDEAREKGRRAADAVKRRYNWQESARHLLPLVFEWEAERRRKTNFRSFDPLTFQKEPLEPIKKGDRVLVDIVTRDRHSYLCSLITSLLGQTFKEWDICIQCDDYDESMPSDHQIMHLMHRCMHEGHGWRIIRSHRQGPHMAHDRTLQMAKDDPHYRYKLICRIDDDIYVRPDYLERLYQMFVEDKDAEIAAVSGVYLDPKRSETEQMCPANYEGSLDYAGKIDHNVPWPYVCAYPPGTKPRQVEHLYSSFMYRVEAAGQIGGYCKRFSQIGHREESDFSYRMFLAGWKLFIQPDAVGFHFSAPGGGIRAKGINDRDKLAASDHLIYSNRLSRWKKRAELRRQKDSQTKREIEEKPSLPPVGFSCTEGPKPAAEQPALAVAATKVESSKLAIVINCGNDMRKIIHAITRFGRFSEDVYVTCSNAAAKEEAGNIPFVKMVATSLDETAMLTKAMLSEGDHEFIMTVSDSMHFYSDPRSCLDSDHDDYVFEVYKSYGDTPEIVIGPECRNMCLITRRRKDAKPNMERILYSDIAVVEDDKIPPAAGKSVLGNSLIKFEDRDSLNWRKICTFQYPDGKLDDPRYQDMVSSQKLVSIIIPTPGRKEVLKRCIDSIYAHTTTPFEIVIIDNDSRDGTMEYLAAESLKRPEIKSHRQPVNLGYQKSINVAMSKAKGEFILLFNDDAWVQGAEPEGADWLKIYVDELKANPKLGLIGPHGCISPALGSRILFFWCVMLRKSLYDKVGPLDDVTFRNYGGDDDYCERVRLAGFEIKERPINLRHDMNHIPDQVKKPELAESVIKLRAKYTRRG